MLTDQREPVLVRRDGALGRLTLNRPEAINALSAEMIRTLHATLLRWETDDAVERVLVDGNGERGFCAGGDLRVVYDDACHRTGAARALWRAEYLLDALVAGYRKPVVTILDGITMGGGVGIGCHAAHRVVTERSVLAMPEVGIGIAPDVGGLLLLGRAPGHLGTHLALTGGRVGPADAVHLGLADVCVPSDRLAPLRRLLRDHSVEEALAAVSEPVLPDPPLCGDRAWIDASYGAASVSAILHALDGRPEDAARAAADRIRQLPPLALCVTLRGLARARELGRLSDVLVQDYRMCCRFLDGRDVREGVRAAVIDKSATPAWHPPRLQDVTEAMVERHFAPLGTDDLDVDRGVRASPG